MTNRTLAIVRDGEPEPSRGPADQLGELDPRTIDAVTRLLSQVERTTRAARPVIMYAAPVAVAEPRTQSGPAPIDVRIPPAPADAPASEPAGPLPRLFTRAEVSLYCGMTAMGSGGLGFALAHIGVNLVGGIPIIGGIWVLISAAFVVGQDGRYGQLGDVRGRVKVRKGAQR